MKHLTQEQRYEIYGYIRAGYTKCKIAEMIGAHKSTITREIQRNGYGRSVSIILAKLKRELRDAGAEETPSQAR